MSLERKDIRAKLDPDTHAKLRAICETDGLDMGLYIEQALIPVIEKRVHDAMMLANALLAQGITGNIREWAGMPRSKATKAIRATKPTTTGATDAPAR